MSPAYDWESNENQELAIETLRSVSLSGQAVSAVDTRHSATKNVFKTLPIERSGYGPGPANIAEKNEKIDMYEFPVHDCTQEQNGSPCFSSIVRKCK